jgi:protein-tyrosine-phosphatase
MRLRQWLSDLRFFTTKEGVYRQQLAAFKAECDADALVKRNAEALKARMEAEREARDIAEEHGIDVNVVIAMREKRDRLLKEAGEKQERLALGPRLVKVPVRGTVHRDGVVDPWLAKSEAR